MTQILIYCTTQKRPLRPPLRCTQQIYKPNSVVRLASDRDHLSWTSRCHDASLRRSLRINLGHGLAPGGVYHSAISLWQREGLTPHFSPIARNTRAVLSLWHFPSLAMPEGWCYQPPTSPPKVEGVRTFLPVG